MLQGQRDMTTVANMILSDLAPLVDAQQGAFYVNQSQEDGQPLMRLLGGYSYTNRKNLSNEFRPGEGSVEQSVLQAQRSRRLSIRNSQVHTRPVPARSDP